MSAFFDGYAPLPHVTRYAGGSAWSTSVTTLASGRETRNSAQARARRRFEIAADGVSIEEAQALSAFFDARRGRLEAFRFRDPLDHSSASHNATPTANDQLLAEGDGVTRAFALIKTSGGTVRRILKPVAQSVVVAVDGASANFILDAATGLVTLSGAPATGAQITAGFLFDTPVRFDTEVLSLTTDAIGACRLASTPLVEVLL